MRIRQKGLEAFNKIPSSVRRSIKQFLLEIKMNFKYHYPPQPQRVQRLHIILGVNQYSVMVRQYVPQRYLSAWFHLIIHEV